MHRPDRPLSRRFSCIGRLVAAGLPVMALLVVAGPLSGTASAAAPATTAPIPPELYVASAGDSPQSDNRVSVFSSADTTTFPSLANVVAGSDPVAEAVSPDGATVYTVNNGDGTVVPIDTASHSAETALPVSLGASQGNAQNLLAIAVSPDGSTAYLVDGTACCNRADPDANSIVELALTGAGRGSVLAVIPITSAKNLSAIALTPDGTKALVTDETSGTLIPVSLPSATQQRPVVGSPITVGDLPTAIAVTPDGSTALVTDLDDAAITTVDIATRSTLQVPLEPDVSKATPNPAEPQAIAVNAAGTLAYVTDIANGVVVPLILTAGSATPGAPVVLGQGLYPISVAFDPSGTRAYVADLFAAYGPSGHDGEVSVITTATGAVAGIDVPAFPQAVVVTPDEAPTAAFSAAAAPAGLATHFDAGASSSLIGGALTYTWTFGDGTAPVTVKTSTIDHTYRLAGTYTATLSVSDADGTSTRVAYTGQSVLLNGGTSAGTSHGVSVVAGHSVTPPVAYVTNATDDTVTPILAVPALDNPGSGDTGATIAVGSHPIAVAISPDGTTAYVVNYGDGTITPIDTATNTAPPTSSWITGLGSEPAAIAITPDGSAAYVVNGGSQSVSVVDLETRSVDPTTIAVGGTPTGVAISPDGKTAYVTDVTDTAGDGTLIPITLATGATGNPVPVGLHPVALAIAPDGSTAYVVDYGTATVAGTVVPVRLTGAGAPAAGTAIGLGKTATPTAIAITSDGKDADVTDTASGNVADIALPSGTVASQSSGGPDPDGIAALPGGSALFVAQGGTSGAVTELSAPAAQASTPQSIAVGQGAVGIAVTPDQAPVARLSVTPTGLTDQYALDASATTFPSATPAPAGAVPTYTFTFGDSSAPFTTTTPTAKHTYAQGGEQTASVTVTDAVGTSTTTKTTGQTVSLHGGSSATASVPVAVPFATPVVTGVTPASGDLGGGGTITVTGTDLFGPTAGTPPTVTIGGVAATDVAAAADGTSLTATVPAAAAAGSVDVVVATPQTTSPVSAADRYTYLPAAAPAAGAPAVTGLAPSSGPLTGSTGVVITGTDLSGATAVDFGSVAATSFGVSADGTTITALSPPQSSAGTVDVVVTTPAGTSQAGTGSAFTYLPPPTPSTVPVVLGVSPSAGPQGGQTAVTITGTHLTGATHVLFGSVPASSYTVVSDHTITAVTAAAAAAGTVDVTVDTPQGASAVDAVDGYTFQSSTTPPAGTPTPVVTGLSTHAGPTGGGTAVVISGTELQGATAVYFGAAAVPSGGITVNGDGTAITVASPAGTVGTVDVLVTTVTGGTSLPAAADTFSYEPAQVFLPVVTGLSPSAGASGTSVTISGRGLSGLSSVDFGAISVPAKSFTVNAAGTIATAVAPAPVAPDGGPVDVTVSTASGTSPLTPADVFTYLPAATPTASAPVISAVSPAAGPVAGGTGVVVSGSNLAGATSVTFGSTAASAYEVASDGTSLVAVVPAGSGAGTVAVTVVTPVGSSLPAGGASYTYESPVATTGPAPVVSGFSPTSGSSGGGDTVTVRGANFAGTTQVLFGSYPGTSVTVAADGLSLTVITPTGPVGPVDLTVTTPVATSATTYLDVFTYPGPAGVVVPAVTGLSPTSGSANGGDKITVNGTDFAGASSVLFGTTAGTGLTVAPDGDSLTVVTPELPVGAVDVRVVTSAGTSPVTPDDQFTANATGPRGGGYVKVAPARLLDTRLAGEGGPLGAGASRSLTVLGVGGVPATGVSAVALHVTAVGATTTTFVTAYPQGGDLPLASNLNPRVGQTPSNLVMVAPGTGGAITLYNAKGSVQLIVDVQGYVTSSPSEGGAFTALTPSRLLDTRNTGPAIGPKTSRKVQIEGAHSLPATGVAAVVLNITGTQPTAGTFLTAYADGEAVPDTSDLNLGKGQTLAGRSIVPVGSDGAIDVYNDSGSTQVILDIAGYYTTPTSGRSSGGYTALGPVRVLDTRTVAGGHQPLGAQAVYTLQLGSLLPAGATAVVLNLTATDVTAQTFVSAYPGGASRPTVSDVNAGPGQTVPNLVVVKLGAGGVVQLYNDAGRTDLVADLQGYFL